MSYYSPEIECADRETLRKIQSERLVKIVHSCYENVPLYRKRFDEMGLKPDDIQSIDDITKLPFTTKTWLTRFARPSAKYSVKKKSLKTAVAAEKTSTTSNRRNLNFMPLTSVSVPALHRVCTIRA